MWTVEKEIRNEFWKFVENKKKVEIEKNIWI